MISDDRHDHGPLAATISPVRTMSWMARGADRLIIVYQKKISPLFAPSCRFHPSCSSYARRALATESLWRAIALTAWRLLRCQPLCVGGDDPVPADRDAKPRGDALSTLIA